MEILLGFLALVVLCIAWRLTFKPRPVKLACEEFTHAVAFQAVDRIRVTLGTKESWRGPDALLTTGEARVLRDQLSGAIEAAEKQYPGLLAMSRRFS